MTTFLAFLKKAGTTAVKKITSKLGEKLAKRAVVQTVKKAASGVAESSSSAFGEKKQTKKKRGNFIRVGAVILGIAVCILVILVSTMTIVGLLPLIVLSAILQSAFSTSTEFENITSQYWSQYQAEYAQTYGTETVSESEKMHYLIGKDDYWTAVQSYFHFDQETMLMITKGGSELEDSNNYVETEYQVKGEVHPVTRSGSNITATATVYTDVPVYVSIEGHSADWRTLYAFLVGTNEHPNEADIDQMVKILKPDVELSENPYQADYYSWEELSKVTYVTRNGEEVPWKQLYRVHRGIAVPAESLPGAEVLQNSLKGSVYNELCPVALPDSVESIYVWDAEASINNGTVTYTTSKTPVMNKLNEAGLSIDEDKAINSVLSLTGGYSTARGLSLVLSDGTVSVKAAGGTDSVLGILVSSLQDDPNVLNALFEVFGVRLNTNSGGNYNFGDYTDTGDYCIIPAYGNGPEVIWWSQLTYTRDLYNTSPISSNGCGPSSLAIVYSSLTGDIVAPPQMAKWCTEHGYYYTYRGGETVGTNSIFSSGAKELGLRVDYVGYGPSAIDEALPYLEQGDLIVCVVGRNAKGNPIFSGAGHYLVVRGYTPDGKLLLADPGRSDVMVACNTPREVSDMRYILDRSSVGNTGTVWAIGYDGTRKPTPAAK